jgi:ATP-dependent RNA helicase DeaD
MGREGVAYTFVTPEEGNELTRIEMRINKLLQRDEVPGFEVTKAAPPRPVAAAVDGASEAPPSEPAPAPAKPAPPSLGRRPPKRFRRAL